MTPLQETPEIQLREVRGQFEKGPDQDVMKTRVEVALGKSAQLPCQCTEENSGRGKYRVQWENKHGRVLNLSGTLQSERYVLINDKRRVKTPGDCSLYVYRPQQGDQGDYKCSFYDSRLNAEGSEIGLRVNVVTLVVLGTFEMTEPSVTKSVGNLTTMTSTLQPKMIEEFTLSVLNVTKLTTVTTASTETQANVFATVRREINTTPVLLPTSVTTGNVINETETKEMFVDTTTMTSLTPVQPVNVTQILNSTVLTFRQEDSDVRQQTAQEETVNASVTVPKFNSDVDEESLDFDWMPDEVVDQYHTVQKRDAKWKAYGFNSSVLRITDPWAGRNIWFQQVTHSVKSAGRLKCPCVVKIPSPGTWPAILETVPEPLSTVCQSYALSWLWFQQQSPEDPIMAQSVHLFKPRLNCTWLRNLPYLNFINQHEDMSTAALHALEVQPVKVESCFCSDNRHKGSGRFMGISDCNKYGMLLDDHKHKTANGLYQVTFHAPNRGQSRTLFVEDQILPINVTIGNFKELWWVCGDKAYIFLPFGWTGCCYLAKLKLPYEVLTIQRGTAPSEDLPKSISGNRMKRELAQFHKLESYHWRISLGEKWGIGLFPWYGVTFLADHIDNITYTLQGFANETIKGFEYLSNTQRSHRLTLLKHDMALDYILARQGGLCVALNLTGDACNTLIPDNSDNITSVIDALKHIRDAFGSSQDTGWSANAWLQEKLGPLGAVMVQILVAVLLSLSIMFCCCTLLLPFAKAMILRWVGIVMTGEQSQVLLLHRTGDDDDEEVVVESMLMEKYPF